MDAYAGSVGFSGPGPSQIWNCTSKQIPNLLRQQLKGVVSGGSDMFKDISQQNPKGIVTDVTITIQT